MKKIILFMLFVFLSIPLFSKGTITVKVTDIKPDRGENLAITLYNSEIKYDAGNPKLSFIEDIPSDAKEYTFTIEDVDAGTYMILGLHDSNDNQKMDKGLFGIPREGFFNTNNQNRPSWEKCSFEYNGEDINITLKMIYYW